MGFEGRRDEDDLSANGVGGHAPFDCFLGIGERGMNPLPRLLEDRPRKRRRPGDVGVDPLVPAHRSPPPSISRTTATTMTNRLRFRPAVLRDAIPIPAPITASGM